MCVASWTCGGLGWNPPTATTGLGQSPNERRPLARADTRVRVVLADDHPMYREGLARAIRDAPELELVGEAGSGREALEQIRELEPDVAVLDVRMPEPEGPRVLRALRRDGLDTEVLFLSADTDSELAYRLIADGAKGYLSTAADR